MNKSIGTIEVIGLTNAIYIADIMSKAADIEVNDIEISKGFGYSTVKIIGEISSVKAAIDMGIQEAKMNSSYVSSNVIARPSEDIYKIFVGEKENRDKINEEKKDEKSED